LTFNFHYAYNKLMKNLLVVISWVNLSLATILFSIVVINQVNTSDKFDNKTTTPIKKVEKVDQLQMYAALPPVLGVSDQKIDKEDARPVLAANYLKSRGDSPLSPYTDFIVRTCDKYFPQKYINCDQNQQNCQGDPISCVGIIIAIAECESNLCTKIPAGSNNCWGYGIPTGAIKGTEFSSLQTAIIKEVELIKNYTEKGLLNLETIGAVYAPPSVEKDHSWAKCVSHFLDKLK